jgi:hypothetical protein
MSCAEHCCHKIIHLLCTPYIFWWCGMVSWYLFINEDEPHDILVCYILRTLIRYIKYVKRWPTNAFWFYEYNFIAFWLPTCFGHSYSHLQGGENKITSIIKMCINHSTFEKWWSFWSNSWLNNKTVVSIQYQKLKAIWNVGLWNYAHRKYKWWTMIL